MKKITKRALVLAEDLVNLGFKPYSAKAVVALVYLDKGNSTAIAEAAGIPRTSVYAVMKELVDRNLAEVAPGYGPIVWSLPGVTPKDRWLIALGVLSLEASQRLDDYHGLLARLESRIEESSAVSA